MIPVLHKNMNHFDIMHVHDCRSFQGISAYFFAKDKKIPYVFQPHGSYLSPLPRSLIDEIARLTLDKFISGKIVKNASKVIALSQVEAEKYLKTGVPEEKIVVIPNGIDLLKYADLKPKGSFKKKFGIDDDKKIILYLGRIHKTKSIDLLVKAYAWLKKSIKLDNVVLVIAGPDDGYFIEVKSLVDSLGISESVVFTGFISSEDKISALVDASVFVTPSFYGFPMTFLEACIVGTPIIATTLGDRLDWINGNVGYVTHPILSEIAESIHRIICNDELHDEFSRNCKEIVKSEFSLKKVVDELEQTYRKIVGIANEKC
jgi:glycosyltransferase involved in cell wall biosynthesis